MNEENLLTAEVEAPPENAAASTARPNNIPEKFWDAKEQKIRVEALLNSYLHLERKLSSMLPLPQNDDDKKRLYKALGVPDSAEGYQVTPKSDLIEVDADLNQRLHQKGFTAEQVQEVYDLAAEKMVPLILEMAAEFQADRELDRLVNEFDGAEKWHEVSRQLLNFGKKNLPSDVLAGLSSSYAGVMALYRLMQNGKGVALSVKAADNAAVMDEKGLQALMRSPKYWRDKDPGVMEKVRQGFEQMYGA